MTPDTASAPIPVYKMSIFAKRNPNLTEEEFFDHLGSSHARLAARLFDRHGVLKYTQVSDKLFEHLQHADHDENFFTSELKERVKSLGLPLLDYDAQCELYFKGDLSWFTNLENDEERLKELLPDEQRTFEQGKGGEPGFWFNLAIEYVRLENGKIVV